MSVQAVMVDIITDDPTTIAAISAQIPLIGDPRLIADSREHQAPTIVSYPDFEGTGPAIQHLLATFRCTTEEDQAQLTENIIQCVMDNIANVGAGSKVKLHLCFHDETPPKGCQEQIIYEVQ